MIERAKAKYSAVKAQLTNLFTVENFGQLTPKLIWGGVLATVVFLLAWILRFWDSPFSGDPAHWGQFGDFIGGTLATILAAGSFLGLMYSVLQQGQAMRKEWELRDEENYTRQAIICLERAFERVRPVDKKSTPKRTRQAWIDCARLLLAAEDLGGRIKTDGFKAMYGSERAHWRTKFYDLFDPRSNFPDSRRPEYFEKGQYGDDELESNSIFEIYRFIKWQEGEADPLAKHNFDWDISQMAFFWHDIGPKAYLQKIKDRHAPKPETLPEQGRPLAASSPVERT